MEFLESKVWTRSSKENIRFKFARLGLERLHYWKLKSLIPDLVLPTRYFMGLRARTTPFGTPILTLTPCDNQNLLPGKHLKEFIRLNEKIRQNPLQDAFFPKWKLNFDTHKFGVVSRSKLKKSLWIFIV